MEPHLIARTEGELMEKSSFADLKLNLEEACAFLQLFAIGKPGFTQQDAAAGIQRVKGQCDRLNKLFASGPNAAEAKAIAASADASVQAAENHLALRRKQSG
jgi:hypothetical protein